MAMRLQRLGPRLLVPDPHGRRGRALDRHGAVRRATSTSFRTSATARFSTPARWPCRRCIASGVNITYKILYNGAVAMTGGQAAARRAARSRSSPGSWKPKGVRKTVVLADDLRDIEDVELAVERPSARPRRLDRALRELEKIARRDRDHLRPAVRRREAPEALARQTRRAHAAPGDPRTRCAKAAAIASSNPTA